jgi:citrate lyase subunit beta / citryl-CoA lyase
MRPSRSALFVPGNRREWVEKAVGYGADTLVLDLEDSVPDREKAAAREIVKAGVKMLKGRGQACSVRINAFATGLTLTDLESVLCPELESISLPKVETSADLHQLNTLLTHLERRMGIPVGQIETPLGCETAKAMRNVYRIATSCPRVKRVTLAAGPGGDAARAIGYQWSKEGTETLFLRSKVILDARAAASRTRRSVPGGTSRTWRGWSATRGGTGHWATAARPSCTPRTSRSSTRSTRRPPRRSRSTRG